MSEEEGGRTAERGKERPPMVDLRSAALEERFT